MSLRLSCVFESGETEQKPDRSNCFFFLRKRNDLGSASDTVVCSAEFWSMRLEADSLVDEVMRAWPATIRVFLQYRMKCVGCPIGPFHTIYDSCVEHNTDIATFLADLRAVTGQVTPLASTAGTQVSGDSANT